MKLQSYATTEFVAKLCPVFKEEEKKKEQSNITLNLKSKHINMYIIIYNKINMQSIYLFKQSKIPTIV